MKQFTCGSVSPLNLDKFDGIVLGYHWSLFEELKSDSGIVPEKFKNKIIRSQFLYGNKHKKPPDNSTFETIEEWIFNRIKKFPQVTEWVLVNEFTDDCGTPYHGYDLDSLKCYCDVALMANPNIKIILGDFRPWNTKKWFGIANIINDLKHSGIPVQAGIQTHIKTINSVMILNALPSILDLFYEGDVHIIESSLWYSNFIDYVGCKTIWDKLIKICENKKIASFCDWWLTTKDVEVGRKMPTFERLNLYRNNYYG